ncbi:zinc-binding dehydrogenase [Streptomyces radicis]|nr:zinc-binding dehydrogenase [Streptomyces radicis]
MREIVAGEFGGPEVLVLREGVEPIAGPGQVVVDVEVVDTLFVETRIRRGAARDWFPVVPPYVPGGGVAGRVASVGAGVDPAWRGRSVVTTAVVGGAYAERVAAEARGLVPVPSGLTVREAGALAYDGTTAMALYGPMRPRPGEWTLITAAAGGMGVLLVQLARAAGSPVIAAARGERKLALLRELGADLVVDYTLPGWADAVREATGGTGAHVVWDGAGGERGATAFALTADGGRFSGHGAPGGGFAAADPAEAERRGIALRGIEDLQLPPEERASRLAEALDAAAAGTMRPVIGATFPLAEAAAAHAAIEAREVTGKTLLVPSGGQPVSPSRAI